MRKNRKANFNEKAILVHFFVSVEEEKTLKFWSYCFQWKMGWLSPVCKGRKCIFKVVRVPGSDSIYNEHCL